LWFQTANQNFLFLKTRRKKLAKTHWSCSSVG